MVTQSRLQKLFDYNHETGELIRKTNISQCKIGDIAGSMSKRGYLTVRIDGKAYPVHRVIWALLYGEDSLPEQLDHINHHRDDNRLCNLRPVTKRDNAKNKILPSNNTSGVIGVHWNKQKKKWVGAIKINGRSVESRIFSKKEDAIAHRKALEKKYGFHKNHGEIGEYYA